MNLNNGLCAICGPIGKYLARGIDTVCKSVGLDKETTEKARKVGGHIASLGLAILNKPEAAAAILSSTAVMPYDPIEIEPTKPTT